MTAPTSDTKSITIPGYTVYKNCTWTHAKRKQRFTPDCVLGMNQKPVATFVCPVQSTLDKNGILLSKEMPALPCYWHQATLEDLEHITMNFTMAMTGKAPLLTMLP